MRRRVGSVGEGNDEVEERFPRQVPRSSAMASHPRVDSGRVGSGGLLVSFGRVDPREKETSTLKMFSPPPIS